MKEYVFDPLEGVCEAYFVIHPDAEVKDIADWLSELDRSESDPRVSLYGLANLCDQALDELTNEQDCRVDPRLVGMVAGALGHFETSVRAYSAILGHRRFSKLATLTPLDALKACLPNKIKLADLK